MMGVQGVPDPRVISVDIELIAKFKDGPNRAVSEFLEARPQSYEIDLSLCDHFGRNVTYNPNGWLRRL